MNLLERTLPITHAVLSSSYSNYARPNDKISYLMKKGILIPLSKGKYVTQKAIDENIYLAHQTANILYGPSYISRFTALSFFNLLAESPTIIESMTIERSKIIKNQIGTFQYYSQPNSSIFAIGVQTKQIHTTSSFLIASPEKAICDIIWTTPHLILHTIKDIEYFLEEDLRLEVEVLSSAKISDIEYCMKHGKKKKEINLFLSLIKKLK